MIKRIEPIAAGGRIYLAIALLCAGGWIGNWSAKRDRDQIHHETSPLDSRIKDLEAWQRTSEAIFSNQFLIATSQVAKTESVSRQIGELRSELWQLEARHFSLTNEFAAEVQKRDQLQNATGKALLDLALRPHVDPPAESADK